VNGALLFFGILIVFVVVAVAAVYIGYYLNQQRIKAYTTFCASSGYQFVADRDGAQQEFVHVVPFFNRGYARRWRYEISGQYNGVAFTAFQYDYTISTGRSSSTYRHAMLKWKSNRPLPQFTLGPETFFTRIGDVLGFHDIDFADDPAFSSSYRLKGADEDAVGAFFSSAMRQQLSSVPGQHAAGADSVLFWWRDGGLPAPEAFAPFLTEGDQVRAILLA